MELEQTKDEISKIKEELDQQQKMKGNTHCCVFAGGGGRGMWSNVEISVRLLSLSAYNEQEKKHSLVCCSLCSKS